MARPRWGGEGGSIHRARYTKNIVHAIEPECLFPVYRISGPWLLVTGPGRPLQFLSPIGILMIYEKNSNSLGNFYNIKTHIRHFFSPVNTYPRVEILVYYNLKDLHVNPASDFRDRIGATHNRNSTFILKTYYYIISVLILSSGEFRVFKQYLSAEQY